MKLPPDLREERMSLSETAGCVEMKDDSVHDPFKEVVKYWHSLMPQIWEATLSSN